MKTYPEISESDLSPAEIEALETDRIAERFAYTNPDENLRQWVQLANKRHEELISGAVKGIPAEEVFAELLREFGS